MARTDSVIELLASSSTRVIHGDAEISCRELVERGDRLARRFTAAGLDHGDRIAVQMANTVEYLEVLAACAFGGFVLMSVNSRFGPALATSIIERSGAALVLRDGAAIDRLPTIGSDGGRPGTADDRYVIFTTSGTTSAPKLVVHRQRSVAVHAGDAAQGVGYDADAVVLVALPLCGTFGLTTLMAAIAADATVVLPTVFDAEQTAGLVRRYGVTAMQGSDDMFHRMLQTGHDLSSITSAGYGRFNSSLDAVVTDAAAAGVTLAGIYGMSEVQALFSWRPALGDPSKRWVAGGVLTSSMADYRIVDDELQLRGPSLFEGYLADGGSEVDIDLTDRHFDGDWFRTGDHAVAETPRSFAFVSRLGDSMRLGGFLVSPAEVEQVLLTHGSIDQAQVVAVDRVDGARPIAFVIAAVDSVVDQDQVIAHCRDRLARFKCPIRVVTVESFPVTDGPNGVKIQRAELRRMAADLLR